MCNVGWVDPPIVCDDYEGQKAGTFDHSEPVANRAGRTDVEGCCWWGRGVIQTTGVVSAIGITMFRNVLVHTFVCHS